MNDCLFCKIVAGDIPSKKVYEDDKILAFYDISPMAKVHVLVIPKEHITSVQNVTEENCELIGYLFSKIPHIATLLGIDENGYRVVTNCGDDGCQSVKHIHFHIIGGQQLSANMA